MIIPESARTPYIHHWLMACMGFVVAMVLIGGLTRLTESGLSIVEWKLLSGTFPPLSQEAWVAEFDAYKETPEYQKINHYMELADFKKIFWLEYLHRLLGRITGLVFLVPFLYFAIRKQMDAPLTKRMGAAFLLVAAQGGVGWVMVQSGLVDDPRVSPVKLASHLTLALLVLCLVMWTKLQLSAPERLTSVKHWQAMGIRAITCLILIQIILGAFVAGMDAGLSYNTFPLMDGEWVPNGLLILEPVSRNFIENIVTVQFQHRVGAYIVSAAIVLFTALSWSQATPLMRKWLQKLVLVLILQFLLGVLTLIHVVPIHLASAHQLTAVLLLTISLKFSYILTLHRPTH